MSASRSLPLLPALGALLLAGCGDGATDDSRPQLDPALTAILSVPLMVDPGLTGLDRNASVITADGASRVAVPLVERGPDAIAAAKGDAAKLAGGRIASAPVAVASGAKGLDHSFETAAQVAAASGPAGAACARAIDYSAIWAVRLPAAFGVYPRGAVQEAAGTDQQGCGLRVVNFLTPVTPGDVMDFYYTRARTAGFDAQHRLDGETDVLGGRKAGASYVIYARARSDGLTEVNLVSSGG